MPWALAISPTNRELSIARSLTRWNFPNLVFKIRNRIVRRGRLVDHVRPAFPRYIFCDPLDKYHQMRARFGIVDFVRDDGERIATVPDHALKSLRDIADDEDVLPSPNKPSARFKLGDRVMIRGSTMLAGYPAIFQHAVDESRAIVLIDWMGRWCPVGVDERDLENELTEAPRRKRRRRRGRNRNHIEAPGPV
jgi:hypothetical protein